jgi:glycosyltransferase involved in cell wall biosynthesis
MTARPAVVVLVPIQPSSTGNGLAMRADLLVQAAAQHHDVHLVVVPVAGRPPIVRPSIRPATSLEVALSPPGDRRVVVDWLRDPGWRDALSELTPLLPAVAAAPPLRVADEVLAHLGARPVAGVLVARLSIALPGVALAQRLGVPLVVDADDDDEGLHRARGAGRLADRWGVVARRAFAAASVVLAASPGDAEVLGRRHDRRVDTLPNAVAVPVAALPPSTRPATDPRRVLVVGNLGYGPNIDGVRWLVHEVLPRLPATVELHLVGPAAPPVKALAEARVVVHGAVDDLDPHYAGADVVAVPVRHGSGTRIKLLEAFARGRPVVSTTLGAAGLEVVDGRDVVLADDPDAFAEGLLRALDPATGAALVEGARALVARAYDAQVVLQGAGRLLLEAFAPPAP